MRGMTHVATLVCNPARPILTGSLLRRARAALPQSQPPRWLDPGIAADLAFAPGDRLDAAMAALHGVIDGAPVDIIAQPADSRRKRLLAADMDSTMIEQECLDELASAAGEGRRVAAITARAMRGEIAFEPALRARIALLRGLHRGVIARLLETLTLTPGARTVVATMRRHGARTALVSGGFHGFRAACR